MFRTQHGKLHGLRISVSAIAMVTGFTAFVHLPLAVATAIGFARTLFTTVLAVLILHESVGPRRWSATVLVLSGFCNRSARPKGSITTPYLRSSRPCWSPC